MIGLPLPLPFPFLLGVRGDEGAELDPPPLTPPPLPAPRCLLTNIDFVPSTNRPPSGGPSEDKAGDEGPAPGDCGGSVFPNDGDEPDGFDGLKDADADTEGGTTGLLGAFSLLDAGL